MIMWRLTKLATWKHPLIQSYTSRSYCKICVKRPLSKRPKIGFQDQLVKSVAECSEEHSAILLTSFKLPFVIKIFVLFIFEWPFTQVLLFSRLNILKTQLYSNFKYLSLVMSKRKCLYFFY